MKAVIHIGLPKVGSSSIQEFLRINRLALADRGVRYAPFDPAKGSQFELPVTGCVLAGNRVPVSTPLRVLGIERREDQRRYADRYRDWLDAGLAQWDEGLFVASSEHLQPWLRDAVAIGALDGFLGRRFDDVRYLLYLRPQPNLILSAWSERIRRGETPDLALHVEGRLKALDFDAIVRRWESAVGPARLDVRLVAPETDLIGDFCTAVRIPRDGLQDPRRMNRALTVEAAALRMRLNRWLPVRRRDGSYNPWYFRALRLLGHRLPRPGTALRLDDDTRARINSHFAASNDKLRARRFPGRETLF